MSSLYQVVLALHLISLIAWFAGLFYLPRLFVYHAENPAHGSLLTVMENKLMRFIMRPAAVATIVFGATLLTLNPTLLLLGWLRAKLVFVLLLIAYHGSLEGYAAKFSRGANTKSGKFFRYWNEVPTLLLIIIVFLAILQPF